MNAAVALPMVAPASSGWTLPLVDATAWIGHEPPVRRWIVDGWLARGTGALLVGEDGIGKSLIAQQLATCVAAGKSFLGKPTTQAASLYISCEDDEDELWRRQRTINRAVGVPVEASPALLSSLCGYTDVELGWFDAMMRFELSPTFHGIVAAAKRVGAGLVILDNLAHLFAGNENVRREVAAFCAAIDRLAIQCDATVLVLGHPSKGGAEYSGSTGWSAHVRQRWFLQRPEHADGTTDRDARTLRKSKANYAESGEEIAFRWRDWAFVAEDDLPPHQRDEIADAAAAAHDNGLFLACLRERIRQQRAVSEKPSASFAPKIFATMPESKKIGKPRLAAAMDRLFRLGKIERGDLWKGKDRHPVEGLRETAGNYSTNTPQVIENIAGDCAGDSPRATRDTPQKTAEILAGDRGTSAGDTPPYINIREEAALGAAPPPNPNDEAIGEVLP